MKIIGSKNISYFDTQKQSLISIDDMYEHLNVDIVRKSSLENHYKNSSLTIDRPDFYMQVIPNIIPIPRNSEWIYDNGVFVHNPTTNRIFQGYENLRSEHFKEKLIENLSKYREERIGVELSGGLDSSITLSLLENENFDLFVLGFQQCRYEFRSENTIQNIYAQKYKNHLLVTGPNYLPYKNLLNTPIHPLPSIVSILHENHQILIKELKKVGCKRVLSGHGGDAIFTLAIGDDPMVTYDSYFLPWMLDDCWIDEFFYQPNSISYQSVFNLSGLSEMISICRKNQKEDVKKDWARNFFKDWLPHELVNYRYKAASDGIYYDGLRAAIPEILEVCRCAYDITKNEYLKPTKIEEAIKKHLSHEVRDINLVLAYVSYAVWIYTLMKKNII